MCGESFLFNTRPKDLHQDQHPQRDFGQAGCPMLAALVLSTAEGASVAVLPFERISCAPSVRIPTDKHLDAA